MHSTFYVFELAFFLFGGCLGAMWWISRTQRPNLLGLIGGVALLLSGVFAMVTHSLPPLRKTGPSISGGLAVAVGVVYVGFGSYAIYRSLSKLPYNKKVAGVEVPNQSTDPTP